MKNVSFLLIWILTAVTLVLSGAIYRTYATSLKLITNKAVGLPVPLRNFPFKINAWLGQDVPIPESIQRVAQNDDFLNRTYVNEVSGQWANVYIAYSGSPRTMLGHQPLACYVAGGWIHDDVRSSSFVSVEGTLIPCLLHRFHKPMPSHDEIIVLNFYILNGRLIANEDGFSGFGWRAPNIAGDPARYVAQVQISAALENSVRAAAIDITDRVIDFFPDSNGNVKAAKYTGAGARIMK
ncbi:MAG: exosortase-associated EpsI family protein [Planctomycetota bacterium]